jgi:hypothetical protein
MRTGATIAVIVVILVSSCIGTYAYHEGQMSRQAAKAAVEQGKLDSCVKNAQVPSVMATGDTQVYNSQTANNLEACKLEYPVIGN